jgi:signal transduction histidine kinase
VRLDWQRKAVVLFAASLLILSVVLVFFALREAEREKLLKEQEIEGERQRLAETVAGRAESLIREAEERVLQTLKNGLGAGDPDPARLGAALKDIIGKGTLVSEIFFVDSAGQAVFFNSKPLFLLPGEKQRAREISSELENDGRWKEAEDAEFRLNDYSRAVTLYQGLAVKTNDRALGSLLRNRLSRCYAKLGRYERAIAGYREQLRIGPPELTSDGIPLGIVAFDQIGNLLIKSGQKAEAAAVFLELYRGLLDSRWPLTRSQFEFFKTQAENQIRGIAQEMNARPEPEWIDAFQKLKKTEDERLSRTRILERVQERIIPLMRLEARESDTGFEKFRHAAEPTDSGLLLASFLPLKKSTILGMLFDPQALARGLFSPASGKTGLREGWSVKVVDETGTAVAGPSFLSLEESKKSGESQLAFSAGFADSFPPWTINIYQSAVDASEKQFWFKRNIYILSLAVVIVALFFGGFLAIRSTAKELKLARLKSDFVATVSHEFRTPLTSIRYMAELLQRGRVREEERKQEYYKTITSESERLSRLVENLLDFSKIETGMKEYRMEETDVAALAAEEVDRFRHQAMLKDFSLETEIAPEMPIILADRESLSRAIGNLLDNAVKYSGENPQIVLRAWFEGGNVCLQVEDNGIGIDKSEQKRIFEKFYRSEKAQESNVKGSGIGLPLVDHIVRAHGGKVLLESELGKGTRVTIKLPVERPDEKEGDKDG